MLKLEELRELRRKRGLSQAQLAQQLSRVLGREINTSTISKWETIKAYPSPEYERALQQVLGEKLENQGFLGILKNRLDLDYTRDIAGLWKVIWTFEENGALKTNSAYADIIHMGEMVYGKTRKGDSEFEMAGHLTTDGVLCGKWFSLLSDSKHHGAFMVEVSKSGKKAKGRWIGTYDDNVDPVFMIGEFLWEKVQ